jgi:cytochrome c oxidase cbb3-type subunit 3
MSHLAKGRKMNESSKSRGRVGSLAISVAVLALAACERRGKLFEQPSSADEVVDPRTVLSFERLFATNCAGCHGVRGAGSAAIGLASPGYLAIVSEADLRRAIADGRAQTAMPAFAESAGGLLSDAQVDALVRGIRAWAPAGLRREPETPPYQTSATGDTERGARVFVEHCGACHGVNGKGGAHTGSIVNAAFLELRSEQSLRTNILAGRPDLGCPDWRRSGETPMTADDVTDSVAWLWAHRQRSPVKSHPSAQADRRAL